MTLNLKSENQDLKKNPHVNETPGGDGYDKREDVADNKRMESIDSGAESDAQPVPNRNQENLQNRKTNRKIRCGALVH